MFLLGEPVDIGHLSALTASSENEVMDAIFDLEKKLDGRGIVLIKKENKLSLATRGDFSDIIEKLVKEEYDKNLTKTAFETLAVILYKSPVAKHEIDYIRGVNSSFVLRNLLVRDFIERERGENGVYVYKPSFKLLRHLGVKDLSELPDFGRFSRELNEFLSNNQINSNE